jgi:anaerobic selenocysteine-containing dehydrogenase
VEYLLLCLDTVCGHWLRGGEQVMNPLTMGNQLRQLRTAQARAPFPAFGYGEKLRVRDLTMTLAGLPTSGMADEMLLPGDGQVHALLSMGGNPASSVPDQTKVVEALRSLDLLVHVDVQLSATAQLADYVIASTLPFEMAATTFHTETFALLGNALGYPEPFAQYTHAIMEAPDDTDVLEQWRLLYRLAQRLDLPLEVFPPYGGGGGSGTSASQKVPGQPGYSVALDMAREPDIDDLLEIVHTGSRIPLAEIKTHPKGGFFPDPPVFVQPKEEGWAGRLDVGNPLMMTDLGTEIAATASGPDDFPFRLLERRMMHVSNTPTFAMPANRPQHNPAFLNPQDLEALDIAPDDVIEIASSRAAILAIVRADDSVRQGTVSMHHSFGGLPGLDGDVRQLGSNPNRLMADDTGCDPYTGQPLMTNVPVRVVRRPSFTTT